MAVLCRRRDVLATGVSRYMWKKARGLGLLKKVSVRWKQRQTMYYSRQCEMVFGLPEGTLQSKLEA